MTGALRSPAGGFAAVFLMTFLAFGCAAGVHGGRAAFPPPPPELASADTDTVSTEAMTRFLIGLSLQEDGNHEAAIAELQRALQVGGPSADIDLALVESYVATNDLDLAEQAAKDAAEAGGRPKEANLALARIRFLRGQPIAGAEALEAARDADPSDFRIRFELGLLYRRLGQDSLALVELRAAQDQGGGGFEEPQVRLRLAKLLEQLGDYNRAREGYESVTEEEDPGGEAVLGRARIAQREGNIREALALYEQAYRKDPSNDSIRRHLVRLSVLTEDLDRAVSIANMVLRVDPTDVQTATLVAGLLAEKGRTDEAEAMLDRLQDGGNGSALVRTLRGRIRLSRGDEAGAVDEFEAAVDLAPQMPEPLAMLAMIHVRRGEGAQAESLLTRANEESPDNPEVLFLLGAARNQMERYQDAIPVLEHSLALRPGDSRTLFETGVAYERTEHVDEAVDTFEKLLKIEPDNALAHNYLGFMMADRGMRLKESLEHIEQAVAKEPDNGYFVDSLGWVYYRLGDYQNAIRTLERALTLVDQGDIRAHLAEVYESRGMMAKARENWERALQLEPGNEEWRSRLESLGDGSP